MRRIFAAVTVMALLLLSAAPVSAQEQTQEPTVRRAIESVLEMETGRAAVRLPRVTLDAASGDLTVIFAMRRPFADDPAQIVASATDDVFTILSAAYSSAAGPASAPRRSSAPTPCQAGTSAPERSRCCVPS